METVKGSWTKNVSPRQALDQHIILDGVESCRRSGRLTSLTIVQTRRPFQGK